MEIRTGAALDSIFRNVTELILSSIRGKNARTLQPGRRQVNYLGTRKREHSRKPDEQYEITEACSPGPWLGLGYEKGDPAGRGSGNSRNGYSSKTVISDDGSIEIAVPRDRNGSFEPQIVAKSLPRRRRGRQPRLDGFDDRIVSLYARGLSVREIQAHLLELYGVGVSPDLISRVTDAGLEEVREWQSRPLDPVYPVIFFDALRVKLRDDGLVRNKAVYVALALDGDGDGEKEVLY
jgi:transposase-like protein